MEYFKSKRFLTLLYLTFTLTVGCVSMMVVSRMVGQWTTFKEKALPAGYLDEASSAVQVSDGSEESQLSPTSWIVRAHDERIGVFDLSGQLQYVVDVYLITLPQADQELLKQGIYVSGQEQLTALMEDYTG